MSEQLDRSDPAPILEEFNAASSDKEKARLAFVYSVVGQRELPPEDVLEFLETFESTNTVSRLEPQWALAFQVMRAYMEGRTGNIEYALEHCGRVRDDIAAIDYAIFRTLVFNCLSFAEVRMGRVEPALKVARQALMQAEIARSESLLVSSMTNEALLLFYAGLYEQAFEHYENILGLGDRIMPIVRDTTTFNLGLVQLEIGQYQEALTVFEAGRQWTRERGQMNRAIIADTQTARTLIALERPGEAREMLQMWLEDSSPKVDLDSRVHAFLTTAEAELALGNTARTITLAQRGLSIAAEQGNTLRRPRLLLAYARALITNNNLTQAAQILQEAEQAARQEHAPELKEVLAEQATVAALQGDPATAYEFEKASRAAADATNTALLTKRVSILEALFELERAKGERDLARSEAARVEIESNRRTLVTAGGFAALAMALLMWAFYRDRIAREIELKAQRAEAEHLEQQVAERTANLQARVNEITEQRAELVMLERKLAESEKFRALGTLTGGMAHDFNNLLAVIMGSAELMQREARDPSLRAQLAPIINATEAGASITGSLLAYARQQQLFPTQINVANHLQKDLPIYHSTLGERVTLDTNLQQADVKVDPGALTTAMINILVNAREAGASKVCIEGVIDAENYLVHVRDDGCGMQPQQMEHAFEPFYSTKDSMEARGLGLSMVDGFAHQSGGSVTLKNNAEIGCTVTLGLPILTGDAAACQSAGDAIGGGNRSLHILLVDDNEAFTNIYQKSLSADGHQVCVAGDGEEALQQLAEATFDLVITDLVMPGSISGDQLAEHISCHYQNTKVIITTGYADVDLSTHTVISKPFTTAKLNKTIQGVFE